LWRWAVLALRNIAGAVLVLVGVIMLVTPGQGILTILAGLALMKFKHRDRLMQAIRNKGRSAVRLLGRGRGESRRSGYDETDERQE